jgi:hypothetical protein
MARLQSANDPMTIWFCASRPRPGQLWDLLVRSPRIAALFELRDNLIGGCVSLRVGKTFFQRANAVGQGNRVRWNALPAGAPTNINPSSTAAGVKLISQSRESTGQELLAPPIHAECSTGVNRRQKHVEWRSHH